MDLDRLAASLLLVGFDGPEPPKETRDLMRRGVGGAILFKRNLGTPAEIAGLCGLLKLEAQRPFLLCVDQEGGRVARLLEGFSAIPAMRCVGDLGDASIAEGVGRLLGEECRAVGFDLDFAPVVDVDSNPDNPVIGDRSFGPDSERCGRLGMALIRGLQGAGVAACAKHFPGHGDTHQDSHRTLPRLTHDLSRLRQVEFPPFEAAARAGVAGVMTAHVVFEALDPTLPATLSPLALEPLRSELGFSGALISDDLEMAAITESWPLDEAAALAVTAGCDLLLVCHHAAEQSLAIEGLRRLAERDTAGRDRLLRAAARADELRRRWARPTVPFETARLRPAWSEGLLQRLMDRAATKGGRGHEPEDPTARSVRRP